ncbi:hypothetical protein F2Q69_00059277 [Brassica cretica]|uniref:Uncharacterized protein n=1 Tax=Brassica cretica TaxID=69181 RepID=A0A8S9RRL4_BRACR|nr:hypothetical protein F2Q69_00059277 [Brassica cretica]
MAPRDSGDSVSDNSTTTAPYIAPEDISGYSSSASTSVPKAQSQTAPPPPPIAPGDISGHIHATRKNGIGLSASMNRWKRCLSPSSGDSVSDSSTTTTPYIAPEDISGYSSSASTSVPNAQSQTAPPPPPIAPGDISVSRSISNTTKRYFIELHSNWNLIPGHIHATRKNGTGLSASMNRWKRCLSPR